MGSNSKKVRLPIAAAILFAILFLRNLIGVFTDIITMLSDGRVINLSNVIYIIIYVLTTLIYAVTVILLFMKIREKLLVIIPALFTINAVINCAEYLYSLIEYHSFNWGNILNFFEYLISFIAFALITVFTLNLCEEKKPKQNTAKISGIAKTLYFIPSILLLIELLIEVSLGAYNLIIFIRYDVFRYNHEFSLFSYIRGVILSILIRSLSIAAWFAFLRWLAKPYKEKKPAVKPASPAASEVRQSSQPDAYQSSGQYSRNNFGSTPPQNDYRQPPAQYPSRNAPNQRIPDASAPSREDITISDIKKYKELLDAGVITEEEFEAKKKQLLGL